MLSEPRSHGEEPILYVLCALIGMIPVLLACAHGTRFGAEETIGALMVAAGIGGLVTRVFGS